MTQQIQNLDIGKVKPDPEQPRKTIKERSLAELSKSISEHGGTSTHYSTEIWQ